MEELSPATAEAAGSNNVGSTCAIGKMDSEASCSTLAGDVICGEPTSKAATATSVSLSETLANSREREIEQLRAANKSLTENILEVEEQLDAVQAHAVAMEEAAKSRQAEEMQLRMQVRMISNELHMVELAAMEQRMEPARKRKSEESLRNERNSKAQQLQQANRTIQALRTQLQQLQLASAQSATLQSEVKPMRVITPLPASQASQRSMTSPKMPSSSPSPSYAHRVPPIPTSRSTLSSFSQDAQDCAVSKFIRNSSSSPLHSPVRSSRRNLPWQTDLSHTPSEAGSGMTKFAEFIEERRSVRSAADGVRPMPRPGDTGGMCGSDESVHSSSVYAVETLEKGMNRSMERRLKESSDTRLERDPEQVVAIRSDKRLDSGLLASQEGRSRQRLGISKGLILTGSHKSLPQGLDAFAEDHARLGGRQGLALMQGGADGQGELAQMSKDLPYSPTGHNSLGRKTRGRAHLRSLAPVPHSHVTLASGSG
uniref:Uncharacterized protein n=1 Tax=Chrysotila carterae TaxID=13221 RepID=A0A7S4C1Q6_CHRCT